MKSQKKFQEFYSGKNQILQSFTAKYQKIKDLEQGLEFKGKKAVIGIGGSSSGARALSFFMKDDISYFEI